MATVRTNISRTFSDLDLNFTKHPVRKDVNTLTAERAVIGAVKNLILTNHYERPFQPEIGSGVYSLLFEPLDHITSNALTRVIGELISNFEPRARLVAIDAKPNSEKNAYELTVAFRIVNIPGEVVNLDVMLERSR